MYKGYLLAIIGIIILSPDALLIRLVGDDPWLINTWRGLVGGIMVLVYARILIGADVFRNLKSAGWWVLWASLAIGISNVAFVYSIVHSNVTDVLVIIAFTPLVSALLSALFLNEKIALRTWIAAIVCGLGLLLLFSQNMGGSESIGLLTAVICAVTMAINFVIVRGNPETDLTPTVGFGSLLNGIVGLSIAPQIMPEAAQIMPLAIMVLIVGPLSFVLLLMSLRYITAPETGLIMLAEAILGSLWVWLIINEQPTSLTVLSGLLIISTLIVHGMLTIRESLRRSV